MFNATPIKPRVLKDVAEPTASHPIRGMMYPASADWYNVVYASCWDVAVNTDMVVSLKYVVSLRVRPAHTLSPIAVFRAELGFPTTLTVEMQDVATDFTEAQEGGIVRMSGVDTRFGLL